ncbi:hypothetical protein EC991_001072 [Linnemannia zychae]|nr:hypothetical protein EC991_001072 [Linnemannia zychae]
MNRSRILHQVAWDHRVSDDRYLYKIPGAGRLLWQCGWFENDQERWNRMIERLKAALRQYQLRCQEDEKEKERPRTVQERLKMYQNKIIWRMSKGSLFFSPLRELELRGSIKTSTRVAGLLPLVPALTSLKIHTMSTMVLDIRAILWHCRQLEVLHVEAVGLNNVVQIPGRWTILETGGLSKDKEKPPTYRTLSTLRSFVLRRAIFDQSNLEDFLDCTPHVKELHLIYLVKGDSQYDDAGLSTCDYDWQSLFRLLCTLPLTATLTSLHYSVQNDSVSAHEQLDMHHALIGLHKLTDWTVWGHSLMTSSSLILNRPIHGLSNMVTCLRILWDSSKDDRADSQDIPLGAQSPLQERSKVVQSTWWATIKAVHHFLCRSTNLLEFKLTNGYLLLFHLDIHDHCNFKYSDQEVPYQYKGADVHDGLSSSRPIWSCYNLHTLDLDLRYSKSGNPVHDVHLRVLNGYISRTCPRLKNLSVHIPPPSISSGIPLRSALHLRLEGGLCLLARLKFLERLHYRLDTSDCDLWDLNWLLPSGHNDKSRTKRQEKMARWGKWRKEEDRTGSRGRRLKRIGTEECPLTVREQLANLGLIADVIDMIKEMDQDGMVTINDDVILAILARCDILTVIKCRTVSKHLKGIIDRDLAHENADFSTLNFRQRRNITDSAMTPGLRHIFRRASIVNLDGTGIGHYGVMKLVTDYTKELHVERCPRVDYAKLIPAIAGDRWLSYDLDPVHLYTKSRELQGTYDYLTIVEPLFQYSWAVVMMSNECRCRYIKVEKYPGEVVPVLCHACDKELNSVRLDVTCNGCGGATCKGCQTKVCDMSTCEEVVCKGCAIERKCSLCQKEWCGRCGDVRVFQCYGCDANVCEECQPSRLKCSVEEYRQYCAPCAHVMVDKDDHWCCDTGEFKTVQRVSVACELK